MKIIIPGMRPKRLLSLMLTLTMVLSLFAALPMTASAEPAGTLELLTVNLTAGDGKVTLAPQTAAAGFAFYYTHSGATGAAPAYGAAAVGTEFTSATEIPGTNGTPIYVQVYKVETGGNTIVGFGEASATPTPPAVITIKEIPAPAPVAGAAPNTTPLDSPQYTATISWTPADNPFMHGRVYTATITLTPKAGFTLTGVGANFFTVTGANATNAANSGVVTAVFPATAAKPTPTLADLSYDLTAKTYNGSPQGVSVTGHSGVGAITVYYTGVSGTTYTKSTTPPTNAGTYNVTVDILEGTAFAGVTGLALGNYTINAQQTGPGPGDGGGGAPAGVTGSFSGSSTYTKGSLTGIIYIANKLFAQFNDVKAGNATLVKDKDYKAESGSTKITLLPAYLDTLKAGTYTMTIGFKDNTAATAKFTVAEAAVQPITPTLPVNPFTDVKGTDWFIDDVIYAVSLGLINGKTPAIFAPNDNLTYAEAVKLAACMHELYTTGEITLANGSPWYQSYVIYAKENGIITGGFDWNAPATRAGYMAIFAKALPDEAFEVINDIADGDIPDVDMGHPLAEAIYKLYRAGIVQGVDDGHNCNPDSNIRRSEVAAILTRMMDEDARVKFSI